MEIDDDLVEDRDLSNTMNWEFSENQIRHQEKLFNLKNFQSL